MSLRAEHVSFSYGDLPVLRDVSIEVVPGELAMLVGPNGSGKSTLLKLLAGFLTPGAGNVSLDGASPADCDWRQRGRKLAFLGQEFCPGLDFTVRETVMLGRNPHLGAFSSPGKADEEAVAAALEDMELLALAERPISGLSGGERQRTMLAAVLAQRTDHLLLDEPTSALDVRHALAFAEYLRRLCATRGILMVTHDLPLALRYADRVMLLKDGETVASGHPDEVFVEEHLRRAYGCSSEVLNGVHLRSVGFYDPSV